MKKEKIIFIDGSYFKIEETNNDLEWIFCEVVSEKDILELKNKLKMIV